MRVQWIKSAKHAGILGITALGFGVTLPAFAQGRCESRLHQAVRVAVILKDEVAGQEQLIAEVLSRLGFRVEQNLNHSAVITGEVAQELLPVVRRLVGVQDVHPTKRQPQAGVPEESQVSSPYNVLIKAEYRDQMDFVLERLIAAGLEPSSIIRILRVVSGRISPDDLEAIRNVEGVQVVAPDRETTIE